MERSVIINDKSVKTYYLDGYHYNDVPSTGTTSKSAKHKKPPITLKFFSTAQGYVDAANGYKYVYQYKDHLGNNRINYTFENNALKVVEEIDEGDSSNTTKINNSEIKPLLPLWHEPHPNRGGWGL